MAQSTRIGDRFPSQRQRKVNTEFSRMSSRFEDLELLNGTEIPTVEFLQCCRSFMPFFGKPWSFM